MEILIKKNCAGMAGGLVGTQSEESNFFPSIWEEVAEPGTKLTIRRPCAPRSSPSVFIPPSDEFYLLPESALKPEDDFSHLPTLFDCIQGGRTEFTPHSEFYEVD